MLKDKIRKQDIKAICLFGMCFFPSFVYRLFNRDIWLVSERKNEARDNGYWMYKYVRENYPKQKCFYVITKNSPDRGKIKKYNTLINFGSLRHYFVFIATRIRISAHVDSDSPNFRVSNFMDRHHLLRNKRVFLNHGIIKDRLSFVYYEVTKAVLMTSTVRKEYDFCKEEYGYPEGAIQLLGQARYDGLINKDVGKQILILPTWRSWLSKATDDDFVKDKYYVCYQSLLNNEMFNKYVNEKNINVFFLVHSDMQKFIHLFESNNSRITVACYEKYDMQELINTSSIMVTDYSSVAFDMAYLKKPVIYYHFDYEAYRQKQHKDGYFIYKRDGMGPVCYNEKELINEIKNIIMNNFNMDDIYLKRANDFYEYHDNNNCKRIYERIKLL